MLVSDKSSSSSLSDNKASQASDEDDDNEDETVTEALQFNQLSLEEFCMIVLSRVTPVFKGSLCNVPSIIESSINLLHEVLSLMKNFFPANLWMSRMQLNSVMVIDSMFTILRPHVVNTYDVCYTHLELQFNNCVERYWEIQFVIIHVSGLHCINKVLFYAFCKKRLILLAHSDGSRGGHV